MEGTVLLVIKWLKIVTVNHKSHQPIETLEQHS